MEYLDLDFLVNMRTPIHPIELFTSPYSFPFASSRLFSNLNRELLQSKRIHLMI
jgi:hypothetical protein